LATGTYRAAVIGCGKVGRGHAGSYRNAPGTDLVAVVDVNGAVCKAFAGEFGVERTYVNPVDMLEGEKPDIVSVCTWPPLHADLTVAACEAGSRVVLCEKPMALNLAEADRMLDAARGSGTLLCINHQRRFSARYAAARRLIEEGEIGELTQVTGICNGDALTDGTHLIDLTRFLNGDVSIGSVFGAIEMSHRGYVDPDGMGTLEFNETRMRYGHHAETGAMGLLFFENGVRAHLEIGILARGGYQRFFIDGTEGRIEVGGDPTGGRTENEGRLRLLRSSGDWEELEPVQEADPMTLSLRSMISVLEDGGDHLLSGESGRATMEAIMALYESARARKIVHLPFDYPESPLEEMIAAGEVPVN
jgi:UDP-N-acetylglucosamine 3-dehydrogenase